MPAKSNHLHIAKPDIFDFSECLHFLDRGYDECLYSIVGNRILKAFYVGGEPVLFRVGEENDLLLIEILAENTLPDRLEKVRDYVVEWFDLERDLQDFYRLLSQDSRLAFMKDRYFGLRLMGIPDLFEALCWCVIGQQINLSFAYRLKRRLVETYGSKLTYKSRSYHLFPSADILSSLSVNELRKLQFSRNKAEYIIGIAKEFASGQITKNLLVDLSNTEQMIKRLTNIRGIGEWTANYVLMKSIKRMDCITYGDSGLNSAVSSILELEKKPTREQINTLFQYFTGWESYLVIYLWRTLS